MNSVRSNARARLALSLGAFLALGVAVSRGPAVAAQQISAAPTSPSAGLAYDEIARVVQPGATPPPIGGFADDSAVIAALPPLVVPKEGQLNLSTVELLAVVPYVGAWLAHAAGMAEVSAHQAALNKQKDEYANGRAVRQRTGVLARFAYFHGWTRSELAPGYTTIDKPDQGLTMTLDNAAKTYKTVHSAPVGETFTATSAGARGTATLDGTPDVEPLPPTVIGGIGARGYRTTGSITITRASFLCALGSHQVTETEYVSDLPDPRYHADQDATNIQPLVTACTLGTSVSHREPGRLVLYRTITIDDDTPAAFSFALERGNIRTFGEQDLALFQPPADFTEKP